MLKPACGKMKEVLPILGKKFEFYNLIKNSVKYSEYWKKKLNNNVLSWVAAPAKAGLKCLQANYTETGIAVPSACEEDYTFDHCRKLFKNTQKIAEKSWNFVS